MAILPPSLAREVVQGTPPRILLLADTHIGFEYPLRRRVRRRRRGDDLIANFTAALEPALRREVDVVVHCGDLFHRSRPSAALVDLAITPLVRVAEAGVPVFVVPGNHENGLARS